MPGAKCAASMQRKMQSIDPFGADALKMQLYSVVKVELDDAAHTFYLLNKCPFEVHSLILIYQKLGTKNI